MRRSRTLSAPLCEQGGGRAFFMPWRSFVSNAASVGHARRLARPVQAFDGWCCRCTSPAPLPRARVDSRVAVRMLEARLVVLACLYLPYNIADVHASACTPSTDSQLVAPLFHFFLTVSPSSRRLESGREDAGSGVDVQSNNVEVDVSASCWEGGGDSGARFVVLTSLHLR